jgi:hypothetical protein
MKNKMSKSKKCNKCKRNLEIETYIYNEKEHKTCISCAEKLKNKNNVCKICNIRGYFNVRGEKNGIYCKKHMEPRMVNVIKEENEKKIKCEKCEKCVAEYNYEMGEEKYCKKCKMNGMINVKKKRCIKCKMKRASFNNKNEKEALYCSDCKEEEMKSASFKNEKEALYCSDCKEEGMVNIRHIKCIRCKIRANYGIPSNKATVCNKHKEANMIKNPRKKCKKQNCNEVAIYGLKLAIHCENHKDKNDILLVERECKLCKRIDILLDGKCVNYCSVEEKAKEIKRNQKTKEIRLYNKLSREYKEPSEYGKRISRDCGEEKEIGYNNGTHIVFVECDENQHKSYSYEGEINRMKNIYMNEGGKRVLFIRYNPYNYKKNGKIVKMTQKKKEEILIKWLKYYEKIENVENDLSVHYLFYDNKKEDECEKIEPYSIKLNEKSKEIIEECEE